jgi:hypothetical protein
MSQRLIHEHRGCWDVHGHIRDCGRYVRDCGRYVHKRARRTHMRTRGGVHIRYTHNKSVCRRFRFRWTRRNGGTGFRCLLLNVTVARMHLASPEELSYVVCRMKVRLVSPHMPGSAQSRILNTTWTRFWDVVLFYHQLWDPECCRICDAIGTC